MDRSAVFGCRNSNFPRARSICPFERRSLRAVGLAIENDAEALDFAGWAAAWAMGEDHEDPFVRLGYVLDHVFESIRDDAAVLYELREALPALLPECLALWPYRIEDIRITDASMKDGPDS